MAEEFPFSQVARRSRVGSLSHAPASGGGAADSERAHGEDTPSAPPGASTAQALRREELRAVCGVRGPLLYTVPRFRGGRGVSRRALRVRPPCSSQVPEARVPDARVTKAPVPVGTWPGCQAAAETAREERRPVTIQGWAVEVPTRLPCASQRATSQCPLLVLMPPEEKGSFVASLPGSRPQACSDACPCQASELSQGGRGPASPAAGPCGLAPLLPHATNLLASNLKQEM